MVCGWILVCDEGPFEAYSMVCPQCNPQNQQQEATAYGATHPTIGGKSPRKEVMNHTDQQGGQNEVSNLVEI